MGSKLSRANVSRDGHPNTYATTQASSFDRYMARHVAAADVAPTGRKRLWDLPPETHCSIIGTCFPLDPLRRLLRGEFPDIVTMNEAQAHSVAVDASGSRDLGRPLQKHLDERYAAAIKRFAKAKSSEEVSLMWDEARASGDIPGAYWALLTHRETSPDLLRRAFGEVHMLSHLVGSANRADLKRLVDLERQRDALTEKIERQEARLRSMAEELSRLRQALDARALEAMRNVEMPVKDDASAALLTRLGTEISRRERVEARLRDALDEIAGERRRAAEHEAHARALEHELRAIEPSATGGDEASRQAVDIRPLVLDRELLLVGGRTEAIPRLRRVVEDAGGALAHHDGGVEDRLGLLPALVARADLVLFAIDAGSHAAMHSAKRACRQHGKSFLPLRTASMPSLLAALTSAVTDPSKGSDR